MPSEKRCQDWLASRGVTNVLLNVVAGESTVEQFWRAQGFAPRRTRMGRMVSCA